MRSEGQIFRKAYGALDRLAPAAPDFDALGTIKLTSATRVASPSRWLMGMAAAGVIIVVALIPALLLGPLGGQLPFGSGAAATTLPPMVTTTLFCGDPTTTTTISPGGTPPATAIDSCATSTSGPFAPGTTTTTIEPSSTTPTTAFDPDRIFTVEEAADFLIGFLGLMGVGRYDLAEPMYAGTYQSLIEWNPTIDSNDRVALLEAGCQHQLLCDLTTIRVPSGSLDGNIYTLLVILERPDGSEVIWQDQDGSTRSEWEFQVVNDRGVLRSLSLPLYLP